MPDECNQSQVESVHSDEPENYNDSGPINFLQHSREGERKQMKYVKQNIN